MINIRRNLAAVETNASARFLRTPGTAEVITRVHATLNTAAAESVQAVKTKFTHALVSLAKEAFSVLQVCGRDSASADANVKGEALRAYIVEFVAAVLPAESCASKFMPPDTPDLLDLAAFTDRFKSQCMCIAHGIAELTWTSIAFDMLSPNMTALADLVLIPTPTPVETPGGRQLKDCVTNAPATIPASDPR